MNEQKLIRDFKNLQHDLTELQLRTQHLMNFTKSEALKTAYKHLCIAQSYLTYSKRDNK